MTLVAWANMESAFGQNAEARLERAIELVQDLEDIESRLVLGDALLALALSRSSRGRPADFRLWRIMVPATSG